MGAKCTVMNDEPSEYETTEYEYRGKKVRIVYVHGREYFVLSINNRLLPQHYMTKAAAIKEAFRILSDEDTSSSV